MVLSANSRISSESINDLVLELEELRIESERSIQEIERLLRDNRRREARLEQRIERARVAFARGNRPNNRTNNRANPFTVGDRVCILNPTFFPYFNDIEKDSNGTVTSISKKGRICILTDNGERTNHIKKNVTKLIE